MSRFSKIPVQIPTGVKVEVTKELVKVTGPKGSLERKLLKEVGIEMKETELLVKNVEKTESKFGRAIVGTTKSHISNMVHGVTEGWQKKLEMSGTGYRAEVKGNELVLIVGLSHPVSVTAENDIKFAIEKNTITIEGIDKDAVGAIAAKIKAVRPPDPYKGKGIKYAGEILKLKPGKQAAKAGGSA